MLYGLVDGSVLYCASASLEDGWYVFPADKSAGIAMGQGGQAQIVKMRDTIGKPTKIRVPLTAIVSVKDITDEALASQLRAALSGLVLAK